MSVVWRASISSRIFYKKVRLGPHEDRIRSMIDRAEPGNPEDYAVNLAFLTGKFPITLDPHREKFGGVNYVRIYLAGWIAYVKVDQRPTPEALVNLSLSPDRPCWAVLRDFATSNEFPVVMSLLRK